MENKKIIIAVGAALIILTTVITFGIYFQKNDNGIIEPKDYSNVQPIESQKTSGAQNNSGSSNSNSTASPDVVVNQDNSKDEISQEFSGIDAELNSIDDNSFGEDKLSDSEVGL